MLENALRGGRRYWLLIAFWTIVILAGVAAYGWQLASGLTITGMSRDITWGLYISQFTFLVGVAASAVMVVLPYYLHDFRAFGRMVILGEFLAVAAVLMCMLFIFVDLGQPRRVLNVMLHPSLSSMMFWDMLVLSGYLILNLVIGCVSLDAERKGAPPPGWVKPLVFLSIPWAVSIHTVTAFLYSGLAARPYWMSAILGPRFLASAFASGPCLLILLALILRRYSRFDAGREVIQRLATIVTYAVVINLFFVLVELFTALYGHMPHHLHPFEYLFVGLHGKSIPVPWMWASILVSLTCAVLLLFPRLRRREGLLASICLALIAAIWIEKGMGMVVTGFVPTPMGKVVEYVPTGPEIMITAGVYGIGFLILSVLYRIVTGVREKLELA